jgi:hypothetical protein
MTDRLTPVGSRGGAEASFAGRGVLVQIVHDNVVGDVARGGREVAPRPEPLAPIACADVLELLLDLARRASLGLAHEVADPDVGRDFDEHVDMITRQRPADDRHPHLGADLPDDLAHPGPHLSVKHLVAIFGRPDDVIAVMKKRVTARAVAHSRYPRESETSRPSGGLTFPRIPAIERVGG